MVGRTIPFLLYFLLGFGLFSGEAWAEVTPLNSPAWASPTAVVNVHTNGQAGRIPAFLGGFFADQNWQKWWVGMMVRKSQTTTWDGAKTLVINRINYLLTVAGLHFQGRSVSFREVRSKVETGPRVELRGSPFGKVMAIEETHGNLLQNKGEHEETPAYMYQLTLVSIIHVWYAYPFWFLTNSCLFILLGFWNRLLPGAALLLAFACVCVCACVCARCPKLLNVFTVYESFQ